MESFVGGHLVDKYNPTDSMQISLSGNQKFTSEIEVLEIITHNSTHATAETVYNGVTCDSWRDCTLA